MDLRKAHDQLKFLMVKHALNQIYFTTLEVHEIVSIKKTKILIINLFLVKDI